MSERDRARIAALILPRLDALGLPPQDRAELRRLLGPPPTPWPYDGPGWSEPRAREEAVRLARLTCGDPHDPSTRF